MPLGADDDDTAGLPRAGPGARAASAPPRPSAPRAVAPSVAVAKKADTGDVYEAETRVGSMPAEILDALREQGLDGRDAQQQHLRPTAPPPRVPTNAPPGPIPRAYTKDADDDDDDAATRVHKDGKKIALGSFDDSNVETQFQRNPLHAKEPPQNSEVITSPANPMPPRPAPLPHLGGTLTLSAKAPTPPITAAPPPLPTQPAPTQTAPALPVPPREQPAVPTNAPPPVPFVPPPPAFVAQASAPVMASFEPPPPQPSFPPQNSPAFSAAPPPVPVAFGASPSNNYPAVNTYPPPFAPPTNMSVGPELGPGGPVSNKHWILIVALSFVITLAVLGVVISRLL